MQLHEMACIYIASVLHSFAPDELRDKLSPILEDVRDRLFVGSVRNPSDRYVSLWSYGHHGRGAMHARLTYSFPTNSFRKACAVIPHARLWSETVRKIIYEFGKDHREWIGQYADVNDPSVFRTWLKALLSEKGKRYLMENYPVLPLAAPQRAEDSLERCTAGHLFRQYGIIDHFVRTARLKSDLSCILDDLDIVHTANDLKRLRKINTSKRHIVGYYYDTEAIELERAHDFLIVEEFSYEIPVVRTVSAVA